MTFDLSSLERAAKFAGETDAATSRIARGIETMKALFQKSERSPDPKIKLALNNLTMQVATAQLANAELKREIAALQESLAKAKAL